MTRAALVAIAGGSCSGKTTLVEHLATTLGGGSCTVVHQDRYYFDLGLPPGNSGADLGNFDHPDAIDFAALIDDLDRLAAGESVRAPVYDFTTHCRTSRSTTIVAAPLVLIDGTLLLTQTTLVQRVDYAVFLNCDRDLRFARRLARDQRERGRTADSVRRQFDEQVEPMHSRFVQPSSRHADLIASQSELDRTLAGHRSPIVERCRSLTIRTG